MEAGFQNTWKTITVGANDHAATITGLKKYGAYVFQVGAFTRKGRGTLSKGYMIRTDEDGWYLNGFTIVFFGSCNLSSFFRQGRLLVTHRLLVNVWTLNLSWKLNWQIKIVPELEVFLEFNYTEI